MAGTADNKADPDLILPGAVCFYAVEIDQSFLTHGTYSLRIVMKQPIELLSAAVEHINQGAAEHSGIVKGIMNIRRFR